MSDQIPFSDSDSHQQSYPMQVAENTHNIISQCVSDYNESSMFSSQAAAVHPRTLLFQPSQNHIKPMHPNIFYYLPPNDYNHYDVCCKAISYDNIIHLLNHSSNKDQLHEKVYHFFYRQQYNDQFYQVMYEMVSPILINNYLNRNIHGNHEIDQSVENERLVITLKQKENIEFHLKQYLSQYLLN
jgi:hypothetical protein